MTDEPSDSVNAIAWLVIAMYNFFNLVRDYGRINPCSTIMFGD